MNCERSSTREHRSWEHSPNSTGISTGSPATELVEFVEADIDNLIDLFDDFNSGTHGESGRFPLSELAALKTRVEDAVKFVFQVTQG